MKTKILDEQCILLLFIDLVYKNQNTIGISAMEKQNSSEQVNNWYTYDEKVFKTFEWEYIQL